MGIEARVNVCNVMLASRPRTLPGSSYMGISSNMGHPGMGHPGSHRTVVRSLWGALNPQA